MNNEIAQILYLTHDKWGEESGKDREEFKDFLEKFVDKNDSVNLLLQNIYELGLNEKALVIKRGVMNILKDEFPNEFETLATQSFSKTSYDEMVKRLTNKK